MYLFLDFRLYCYYYLLVFTSEIGSITMFLCASSSAYNKPRRLEPSHVAFTFRVSYQLQYLRYDMTMIEPLFKTTLC
jgi:hypothetical protein